MDSSTYASRWATYGSPQSDYQCAALSQAFDPRNNVSYAQEQSSNHAHKRNLPELTFSEAEPIHDEHRACPHGKDDSQGCLLRRRVIRGSHSDYGSPVAEIPRQSYEDPVYLGTDTYDQRRTTSMPPSIDRYVQDDQLVDRLVSGSRHKSNRKSMTKRHHGALLRTATVDLKKQDRSG